MKRHTTRREILGGLAVATPALIVGAAIHRGGPDVRHWVFSAGEGLSYRVHRALFRNTLAPEYTRAELSPRFPTNGNTVPESPEYTRHAATGFRDWALTVRGLVAAPQVLSLGALRAMPARAQITRHDCVEGWSAIGEWTGVPLGAVLRRARLLPEARFIVFHCADDLWGFRYYESVDLVDAFHPQTILAYGMNGRMLPVAHGAPVRLRVERQLGYKHAKFVMSVEAVDSLSTIGYGKGGLWEDVGGYQWYAGI